MAKKQDDSTLIENVILSLDSTMNEVDNLKKSDNLGMVGFSNRLMTELSIIRTRLVAVIGREPKKDMGEKV